MGNLLPPFPNQDAYLLKWPHSLVGWMHELYRAVSGEFNVCHLGKTALVDDIGGIATTAVQIRWDLTIKKQPGFTHSTLADQSKVYVQNTGRYMVTANVCATNVTGAAFHPKMYAKKNGVPLSISSSYDWTLGVAWKVHLHLATEVDLLAGDYVEIETYVQETAATNVVNTIAAECECIVRRIA